jgi:hypothetical protein
MSVARFIVPFLLLHLSATTFAQPAADTSSPRPFKAVDYELTQGQCEAKRGTWGRSGGPIRSNERYFCFLPSSDGGKACTSSKECLAGTCLSRKQFPDSEPVGSKTKGICATYAYVGGCVARVEDGRAQPMICVD